jgi:hypothetical protein
MGILEMNAWAGETVQDGSRVLVCLHDGGHNVVSFQATALASKMYANIGVTLDWQSGSRACKTAGAIHVALADDTPDKLMPGALAYALPYEGIHIRVFFDRIRATVPESVVPSLLAHVLVHEIGHILQGINRHSAAGVMKAHWAGVDYHCMLRGNLPFTEEDTMLIHRGMEDRAERLLLAAELPARGQSR